MTLISFLSSLPCLLAEELEVKCTSQPTAVSATSPTTTFSLVWAYQQTSSGAMKKSRQKSSCHPSLFSLQFYGTPALPEANLYRVKARKEKISSVAQAISRRISQREKKEAHFCYDLNKYHEFECCIGGRCWA